MTTQIVERQRPETAAARMTPDRYTGADALCERLVAHDVSMVFGHPGGAILPVYDALTRVEPLQHVLVRHEQSAVHAADGYARVSGQVGVVLVTSGPGATNTVTGLATAMMDGVPLVVIAGQVPTSGRGLDFFQEADMIGIGMSITKHGFYVTDPNTVGAVVDQAFALAMSGRPGPVLIDLPKDVQTALCSRSPMPVQRTVSPKSASPGETIMQAADLVNNAKRPLILVGRGVVSSQIRPQVLALATRTDTPVATTLLGLDGFPGAHSNSLGMLGMHGTLRANLAVQDADVILGLGLRFDDRIVGKPGTFAPHARVIHFDIAPSSIGRTVEPHVSVVGDLRDTFPDFAKEVMDQKRPGWLNHARGRSHGLNDYTPPKRADALSGRVTCRALAKVIDATAAIVTTDVGQHQMWMAQEFHNRPLRSHVTSGGLGTMGYALPAAIGAAFATPSTTTWAVIGDGGFQMTLQELATVADHRLDIKIVVINNGTLGMVRQWQQLFYEQRYSASTLSGPDIVKLGDAFGVPARRASSISDLEAALDWACLTPGPVLLEIVVDKDDLVYPMVEPGAPLERTVTHPTAVA